MKKIRDTLYVISSLLFIVILCFILYRLFMPFVIIAPMIEVCNGV